MSIVAIIPAHNAKSRANLLLPVGGKPMMAWTIEAAIDTWSLDHVFVSTDCPKVASCARSYGAEVIESLLGSTGEVSDEEVMRHGLSWLWEVCRIRPAYLAILSGASPLRCTAVIDRAVSKAVETGCDVVVTVHETRDYAFTAGLEGDRLRLGYDPTVRPPGNGLPPRYLDNGTTCIVKTALLLQEPERRQADVRAVVISEVEGLQVQTMHGLMIATHYLESRRHTTSGFARLPLMR